jgi:hypothetical protein
MVATVTSPAGAPAAILPIDLNAKLGKQSVEVTRIKPIPHPLRLVIYLNSGDGMSSRSEQLTTAWPYNLPMAVQVGPSSHNVALQAVLEQLMETLPASTLVSISHFNGTGFHASAFTSDRAVLRETLSTKLKELEKIKHKIGVS